MSGGDAHLCDVAELSSAMRGSGETAPRREVRWAKCGASRDPRASKSTLGVCKFIACCPMLRAAPRVSAVHRPVSSAVTARVRTFATKPAAAKAAPKSASAAPRTKKAAAPKDSAPTLGVAKVRCGRTFSMTHTLQTSISRGSKSKKEDDGLPSSEEINAELSAHNVVQLYMQSAIFREKLLTRLAEAEQQMAAGIVKSKKGGKAAKAKEAKEEHHDHPVKHETKAKDGAKKQASSKGKGKKDGHEDCC